MVSQLSAIPKFFKALVGSNKPDLSIQDHFEKMADIWNEPGSQLSVEAAAAEFQRRFSEPVNETVKQLTSNFKHGEMAWTEYVKSFTSGTKLLKIAGAALGNALISFVAVKGLEMFGDWIDKTFIHKTERLAEAAQDASNDIDELNSKFADAKKLASDSGKRFAELAQGVEVMTGKNLSLSDDEYAEFLSISQQLADTFPTLSRVYGENGEAIVQLSGDVDTIVGSLNDLVEVQRLVTQQEVSQKLPDVFKGAQAVAKETSEELKELKKSRDTIAESRKYLEESSHFLIGDDKTVTIANADYDIAQSLSEQYAAVLAKAGYWKDAGQGISNIQTGLIEHLFDFRDLDDSEIEELNGFIATEMETIAKQYNTNGQNTKNAIDLANQKLAGAYNSLNESVVSFLNSTPGDYTILSDQLKGMVQKSIGNIDWSTLFDDGTVGTWEEAVTYVQNNIVKAIKETRGFEDEFTLALETQTKFNNGEVDVATYKAEIEKILELIKNAPAETKKVVELALGVTVDDEGNIETKVDQFKNRVKSLLPDADDAQIDEFISKLSLDQLDPDKFDEIIRPIIDNIKDVARIFDYYNKVMNSGPKGDPSATYGEAVTKLQEYTEKLKALDTVYSKFADQDATTPIELADIDALNKAFADVDNIQQYTRELYEVQAAGGDLQPIFDKICSAFINQSGLIDLVNDNTEDLIKTWLEEQGVLDTNAWLILDSIKSRADAAWNTRDLTQATYDEIVALADETEVSDEARRALEIYIAQKMLANNAIDPSADITALASIVSSLGIATGAWQKYYAAKREMVALESSTTFWATDTNKNGVKAVKQWQSYTTVDEQGNTVEHLFSPERYDKEKKNIALRAELFSKQYAQELEDMAKAIKFGGGATTDKAKNGGSGGGSGSDREEEKETFDWIERKAEIEQRLHDNLQKTLDDESASYREQISALKEMTALDDKRVASATAAAEHYAAAWNEAIQGIDQEHLDYIMNGGDIVELEVPRDVADQLEKAKDIYDKMVESQVQEVDLIKEANDHRKASLDLETEIIKKQQEKLQNEMDLLQARLDLAEAEGHALSTGAYEEQISMSEDMVDLYRDQKEALYDRLAEEEEGSAAYAEYLSAIYDCESAIIDCEKQQAEWNDAIRRLPIDRLEEYVTLIGDAKTDLQNYIDIQTASGKQIGIDQYQTMFDISKTQLDKMLEQRAAMQDLLGSYDYGSGKFNDLSSEIQSLDNSISSLIQEMFGFNDAILKIPIDKMSQLNDEMSLYSDTLGDVLSDYDSALSAVNTLLDDQIESLNDLKEQAEKTYQEQIDPLQEQLDLLSKTNDQRERQLALEQAKYALERAQNQKTSQVKYIA